jgi:hypothetical protein
MNNQVNQIGNPFWFKVALITSGIGIVIFLGIAFTFPFRESLMDFLYPKMSSEAQVTGQGDINEDGIVDVFDLGIFGGNYGKTGIGAGSAVFEQRSDLNQDGNIDVFDLGIFASVYGNTYTPTPSSTPSVSIGPSPTISPTPVLPTATATPIPTTSPYATPTSPITPTPNPSQSAGIWISPQEIMALPNSGTAWAAVENAANSAWGSPCLNDDNCTHDVNTLAGALVAVRNNDSAMRSKVIQGLQSAMQSPVSRVMELSRGLPSYIIAADIIDYRTSEFDNFIKAVIAQATDQGHSATGGCHNAGYTPAYCGDDKSVLCTAVLDASSWGGQARAALTAGVLYLDKSPYVPSTNWAWTYIQEAVTAYKAFIGVSIANYLTCSNTDWHEGFPKAGVNAKGAMRNGVSISGVLPEDWSRGAEYNWPPTNTEYMWEGMQGFVVTAVMMHRAGFVDFGDRNNVVVRAMDMLYGQGEAASNSPTFNNPPTGDNSWIPWVVNYYANTDFNTSPASYGKSMGWTDWTHAP